MTYPTMATIACTIPKTTSRIAPIPAVTWSGLAKSSNDPGVPNDTMAPTAPPTLTAATASRDRSLPGRKAASARRPAISSRMGT